MNAQSSRKFHSPGYKQACSTLFYSNSKKVKNAILINLLGSVQIDEAEYEDFFLIRQIKIF